MRVSGYLLPFPDPGAADLMSDHLEQEVPAAGPGTIRLRVSLPGTRFDEAGSPAQTGTRCARTKLEVFQAAEDGWVLLWRSYWIPGSYVTRSSMSAGSNALPRLRTLCTNSKNPR